MSSSSRALSLIALLASLCLACSPKVQDPSLKLNQVRKLMVISEDDWLREHGKACQHMRHCQMPLICIDGRCDAPPSLLGQAQAQTPRLSFEGPKAKGSLYLELQDDDYSRARGMMMRRHLAPNWGLLFIYAHAQKLSFWMKNCYIPLDMVFLRDDGSVDKLVYAAQPFDESLRYTSTGEARFVLELAAGSLERLGIDRETRFDLSPYLEKALE